MFHQNYSLLMTGKNLKDMSNLMTDQMKCVTDWLKINMLTQCLENELHDNVQQR